jgi:hypothetical protein
MEKYRIVRFPNRGRGVEATNDLPQGTIVVTSPCVVVPNEALHASLANYAFRYGDQVALAFGAASLFNHSRSANCDHHADQVNRMIVVSTNRLVRRGEELTIDYGWEAPDFVRTAGRSTALEPGSESHRCWLLAEAYRAADRLKEAAQAYAMRAAMSADDEAWYARVQEARCLRMMGDEGGFVRQALAAFDQRPRRAEALYDLARFCREHGMNTASMLFSEAGLALPRPGENALFVEDFVYTAGLKEEFALAAYYATEPAPKRRGQRVCNWLALARTVPAGSRNMARSNLRFYAEPAARIMPSFVAVPVGFAAPSGYRLSNPSAAFHGGRIVLLQPAMRHREPADARHFLLHLSDDLAVQSSAEILMPAEPPEEAGFIDPRLFSWRGELWCSARPSAREKEGQSAQLLACVKDLGPDPIRLTGQRLLRAQGRHQPRWIPRVTPVAGHPGEDVLTFITCCDPTRLIGEDACRISETTPAIVADRFDGGTPAIAFNACVSHGPADGALALIHEAEQRDGEQHDWHRWVWFDTAGVLRGVSLSFLFGEGGNERAAGLAAHPDGKHLLVSYGVGEDEAWLATIDVGDIANLLQDVEHISGGEVGEARSS